MTSDTQKLVAFIRTAKERQIGDDFIVSLLRQHGWSERRIFAAFSDYYQGVLAETIPSNGSRIEQSPRCVLLPARLHDARLLDDRPHPATARSAGPPQLPSSSPSWWALRTPDRRLGSARSHSTSNG